MGLVRVPDSRLADEILKDNRCYYSGASTVNAATDYTQTSITGEKNNVFK